jgi:hypothetical protein
VLRQVVTNKIDLLRVDSPVDSFRGAESAARPEVGGSYEALVVLDGEAVEHVAIARPPNGDGEVVREEGLETAQRLKPVHHLPLYLQWES